VCVCRGCVEGGCVCGKLCVTVDVCMRRSVCGGGGICVDAVYVTYYLFVHRLF